MAVQFSGRTFKSQVGCGNGVVFSRPVAEISLRKGSWVKLRVRLPGPWDAVSPGVRSVEFELCSVASFTRPKVLVFSDFFGHISTGSIEFLVLVYVVSCPFRRRVSRLKFSLNASGMG